MATFVILSHISPDSFSDPLEFPNIAHTVSQKIKEQCSGITWKESYATLGRHDVVDVIEASDPKEAEKAAMIIRAYGRATTETLLANPWKEFLEAL